MEMVVARNSGGKIMKPMARLLTLASLILWSATAHSEILRGDELEHALAGRTIEYDVHGSMGWGHQAYTLLQNHTGWSEQTPLPGSPVPHVSVPIIRWYATTREGHPVLVIERAPNLRATTATAAYWSAYAIDRELDGEFSVGLTLRSGFHLTVPARVSTARDFSAAEASWQRQVLSTFAGQMPRWSDPKDLPAG